MAGSAQRTISARSLWIAIAALLAVGVLLIVVVVWHPSIGGRTDSGGLVRLSDDSTASVGYAGAVPSVEESSLPRPLGIDGGQDRLYVALADASAIGVFTYDGERVGTLAVEPATGVAVATPVDVAVLSDGRLLVVDTAAKRIVSVDPKNGQEGGESFAATEETGLRNPTAVDADEGRVFVADAGDGAVKEYTQEGEYVRSMRFDAPAPEFVGGLCAGGGMLWVSDSNADRVVGVDLESGSQTTVLPGSLNLPRGVAVGADGEIMVAETFARRVSVFDETGARLLESFPDERTDALAEGAELRAPESLYWYARESRLYVSDAVEGRIKVFNIRGGSR